MMRTLRPAGPAPARAAAASALVRQGVAELVDGQAERACDSLRRALALDPDQPDALHHLGIALRRCGDPQGAIACHQRALALDPLCPALRVHLALALRDDGDLAAAAATCREALRASPDDAEAWNLLGLVLQEQGEHDAAATALRRALQLQPDHPEALTNLGHLLVLRGEPAAAEAVCRRAVALQPAMPEASWNLALALAERGALPEAIAAARRALALRHPFPVAALGLAELLSRQGGRAALEEALELLGQLLAAPQRLTPALQARAWLQAVATCCDLERPTQAVALAEQALQNGHDSPALQGLLGRALADREHFAAAEQAYQRALSGQGIDNPELWHALGWMYWQWGRAEPACQAFRRALELEPANRQALHALVTTLLQQGALPEARLACDRLLGLAPGDAESLLLASLLLPPERHRELLAAVEAATADALPPQRAVLAFASARLHRGLAQEEEAFTALLQANRLQHACFQALEPVPPPPPDPEGLVVAVRAAEAVTLALPRPSCRQRLIFVVGWPRCGSTLVETILARGAAVRDLGEVTTLGRALQEEASSDSVVQRYLTAAAERLGEPLSPETVLVDKQLGNYQYARIIAHLFPEARLVHVHRNPMDQILSILWERFEDAQLSWAYDLDHLVAAYDRYRRVMAHLAQVPDLPLHHCDYDRLVRDPATEIRRLVAFCGLPWQEAYLHPERSRRMVRTASVLQVRQPIHAGSVGGWRRFEAQLRPWAERLEALGYRTENKP